MHEIEVRNSANEKINVPVKFDEYTIKECVNSVIMLSHKSSSVRLAVVLDTKKHKRALVEIPENHGTSRGVGEFFMEIYGVNSNGKILIYSTSHLDPNQQNENEGMYPEQNMNLYLQLTRKHISQARYEVRLPIFVGRIFYKFIFLREVTTDEKHLFRCASNTTRYTIPFPLKPTKEYEIKVLCGSYDVPGRFSLSAHPPLKFKAAMDKSQLTLLYKGAIEFCNNRALHRRIKFLYRNKPHLYFDKIISQNGGIMTKYMKNDGGDQASPLNRAIQGLFFSAFLKTTPQGRTFAPKFSPFGDKRLHVATSFFLNPSNNLYFADFFCHYTKHHITLVVTKANSYSDKFCSENLVPLKSWGNPFLYYNKWKNGCFTNMAVNVEVFYTENINIGELLSDKAAYFTFCYSKGYSRKKSFIGQSKNKNCSVCNLHI